VELIPHLSKTEHPNTTQLESENSALKDQITHLISERSVFVAQNQAYLEHMRQDERRCSNLLALCLNVGLNSYIFQKMMGPFPSIFMFYFYFACSQGNGGKVN
jgi:hypothetical protein